MNLKHLFELQRKLDEHIVKEKGLEGQDLLPKKILALQVELGELANEWRGFKFWSEDQEPRIKDYKQMKCKWCNGSGDDGTGVCPDCRSSGDVYKEYNPLLEEYVDVVHFTLSVGLEIEIKHEIFPEPINYGDAVIQFNELFGQISYFASVLNRENEWEEVESEYERIWSLLFGLAGLLGFTWEQVEQSYLEKNKINHQRQESGY
jgi:dimeric dUTPase (all-alpha-NTP-PPase superfamily)